MRGAAAVLLTLLLATASACRTDPVGKAVSETVGGAFCTIDVVPQGIRIEGNKAVSDADLVDAAALELKAFAEKGQRAADADDAAWSMENYLTANGYHSSKVNFVLEGKTAVFQVEEGKRAVLRSIRLEGVRCLDEEELLGYFDFGGEGPLGLPPVLFDAQALDDAATQVEREYRTAGFQDIKVGEPRVTWSEDNGCADVVFEVTEGQRYCVCQVAFEGVPPCDVGLIGQPFRTALESQAAGKVRSALRDRGYQQATVSARTVLERAQGCAQMKIVADPGPVVRLRCLRLRRLDRTEYGFARSLVPLRRGDVLKQGDIDRSVDLLYRASIFRTVDADVVPVSPGLADLVIDLPEIEARSVEIEAGWGSYERARAALRYEDRNVFGRGRRFLAEARGHTRGGELDLGFVDPWILGSTRVLELDFGVVKREEPSYTFEGLRIGLFVEDEVTDRLTVRAGYRLRSEKAYRIKGDVPEAEREGFVNSAGFFANVQYDNRDSVLLPTKGTFAEAGVFWSAPGLGADVHYMEYTGRAAHHVAIGDVVLAVGASMRTKDPRGATTALPIQERYFLGGELSVRSFEEAELGPVDLDGDPVGGLTSAQAHAEVRFPLGWKALHGAAFYDVGVVNPEPFDLSGPWGHAIGVGLRYYFPFGPLRIDYAYGVGERFAADDRHAVHVALGFSF